MSVVARSLSVISGMKLAERPVVGLILPVLSFVAESTALEHTKCAIVGEAVCCRGSGKPTLLRLGNRESQGIAR